MGRETRLYVLPSSMKGLDLSGGCHHHILCRRIAKGQHQWWWRQWFCKGPCDRGRAVFHHVQPHALPSSSSTDQYCPLTFELWCKGVRQVQIVLDLCKESNRQGHHCFRLNWEGIPAAKACHGDRMADLFHL